MSNFTFNPLQMAIKPLYKQAMAEDALFAAQVREKESRTEKPKSLAECCEYIMGEAYEYAANHKNGNFGLAGMSDTDMMGLIKHYYDEDDIKIKKVGAGTKSSVATTKKEAKPKKPERPKETLEDTHIPMIRPESVSQAKRESKKQAKAVEVLDMFAGMWDEDEDDTPADTPEIAEELEDMPEF